MNFAQAESAPRETHMVAPPATGAALGADAHVWAALKQVMDPELPISLVDLGLIYDVRRRERLVEIDLTFTATGCPCMEFIHEDIRERLLQEPGIDEVKINHVWDPPWTADRISEAGRKILKQSGVAA